jgi:NAD(P) transhydrogenase subunit alpha
VSPENAVNSETATTSIGVLLESASGERRVALDPTAVAALVKRGHPVLVEADAGEKASFSNSAYEIAGAKILTRARVVAGADALAVVRPPDPVLSSTLRRGQIVVGLLDTLGDPSGVASLAKRQVTLVALELLPRTLSRAQSMDALSSQASAAGYRAGIVAANSFDRYLPMMITASGTAIPAKAIVIGTGVAGLQAIATLKRLGAIVTGYDVRAASRQEVESLGATFLTSTIAQAAGNGGYAKALMPEERAEQQAELAAALTAFDIIITTAKVPGHTPPVLVSKETLAALRPGSVCVDLGSSDKGGNVEGSIVDTLTQTANGVTVIGAGELASGLPASASQMYGRNIVSALTTLMPNGVLAYDPADEVMKAIVVCTGGEVTNAAVRAALELPPRHAQPPVEGPTKEKVLVA